MWRRILFLGLFGAVALTVLGGSHYYFARRLVFDVELSSPLREIALVTLAVLAVSVVVLFVAERYVAPPVVRILSWPGALWLGVGFVLLCSLATLDVLSLAMSIDPVGGALLSLIIAGGIALATTPRALRAPAVRRLDIRLARWPAALDGYRIVQISDLHIGPLLGRSFAADVTRRVNALEPDLIAITGDLVDGRADHHRDEVAPFQALDARDGAYFVTGNHDYYSGVAAWVKVVEDLGIVPLRNTAQIIRRDASAFMLAGVEDAHAHQVEPSWREDVDLALEGRDPSLAVVLLAHDPTSFRRAAVRHVDLQLSGHTHGGQIWPFGLIVRLVIPWLAGVYHEGRSTLYVSRGTGFWGPPMRLFAPAEITEITLRSGPISIEASAPAEAAAEPSVVPATAIPAVPITTRS